MSNQIVRDGANSLYHEARIKVCHLLKNPTERNDSFAQLVDEVVRGERRLGRKFFYRLGLRSYTLHEGLPSWQDLQSVDSETLAVALQRSAIINLSQSEFRSSVPQKTVDRWAHDNRERWHCALKEIQPTLVLCGGTYSPVRHALKAESGIASTGMKYFELPDAPSCLVLDLPHPTARYPLSMVHTYLVATCKEIMPDLVIT